MKYYALVNDGLEETTNTEIKEKLKIKAKIENNVAEFSTDNLPKLQSVRRLLMAIEKTKDLNKLSLKDLPKKLFKDDTKFKIQVEGVKGQENRLTVARSVAEKIYNILETKPKLELKKPELLIIVFYNNDNYFLGIDKSTTELNTRDYRVFHHSASFKGDLAFHFIHISQFKPKKNLLIGFCKDAVLAIEASIYSKDKIYAFDESTPNVIAAKKNVKISKSDVKVDKYSLEDLDIKYEKYFFNTIIFQITTKDENKLNEIYHQVDYILKKSGNLMFISRSSWDPSISDKFKLEKQQEVKKGNNIYKVLLMKKN